MAIEIVGTFEDVVCRELGMYARCSHHIQGILCLLDEVAL